MGRKSQRIGAKGERLARDWLMDRFQDLEVTPAGQWASRGPSDLQLIHPDTRKIHAVVQVKSGEDKACIEKDECERLIDEASLYNARAYVLLRAGIRRGNYALYTAEHVLKCIDEDRELVPSDACMRD